MTATRHQITASELLPGDVIVDTDGVRDYAAFDVEHGTRIAGIAVVRVWTAVRDQDNGRPRELNLTPDVELIVDRRDGGPVTTRVEAGSIADADDAATMAAATDSTITTWVRTFQDDNQDMHAYVVAALGDAAGDFDVDRVADDVLTGINGALPGGLWLVSTGDLVGLTGYDIDQAADALRESVGGLDFWALAAEHDRTA